MSGKVKAAAEIDEAVKESSETEELEEAKAPEGAAASEDAADDKYLRLMADFQNYRRRSEKEKKDIYAYASEKVFTELLTVLDDFERALSLEADASGSFVEGMFMIYNNFKGMLGKAGLAEIDALGEAFDPNLHHAVMTEQTSRYGSGAVSEVVQKGYKLNDKVIRPSMVKVAE